MNKKIFFFCMLPLTWSVRACLGEEQLFSWEKEEDNDPCSTQLSSSSFSGRRKNRCFPEKANFFFFRLMLSGTIIF